MDPREACDALLQFGEFEISRSLRLCAESREIVYGSLALCGRPARSRTPISGAGDDARRPTARERVLAFMRERPDEPWCAECVAMRLDLPRARIANVFLAAEGIASFARKDEPCKACGRKRLALVCSRATASR